MQDCCPYGYMLVLAKGCIRKKKPTKLLSVTFGCLGYSEQNADLKYAKKMKVINMYSNSNNLCTHTVQMSADEWILSQCELSYFHVSQW